MKRVFGNQVRAVSRFAVVQMMQNTAERLQTDSECVLWPEVLRRKLKIELKLELTWMDFFGWQDCHRSPGFCHERKSIRVSVISETRTKARDRLIVRRSFLDISPSVENC